MEILNKLISSDSVQAIDKLLANIADTLNVSVDMLKENGMHYVLEYGKYVFWSEFGLKGLLIGLLMFIVYGFALAITEDTFDSDVKHIFIPMVIVIVIWALIILLISLPYIMSPEMYSIKQVIELLQ